MGEPLPWKFDCGERVAVTVLEPLIRRSVLGPMDSAWQPPSWLKPHQIDAARRIRASIKQYGGALLADAVGLGKTYVALAIATTYESTVVTVPAPLLSQWRRITTRLSIRVDFVTHEALSRGHRVPHCQLVVVDEAHRFRNANTRRYDALSRTIAGSRLLLITATPVVNSATDLIHLFRLFSSDNTFALHGVASLESALENRTYAKLAMGTAPAVVARSAHVIEGIADALPRLVEEEVFRPSPVSPDALALLLTQIDSLHFPAIGVAATRDLLRLHLLYRLASSVAACRESVLRHIAYIDRAVRAARRGEALPRQQARRLFGADDDMQLDFNESWSSETGRPLNVKALHEERMRLRVLLHALSVSDRFAPKTERLVELLRPRHDRKTIIFSTAIATVFDIARRLKWRRLAVVSGGQARIASGRIGLDEAFALFAPKSRGFPEPPASKRVFTLIATDMASEGLDLQDADQVIHYDLPWTPLRLEQRVGRIIRLGSEHTTAAVCWFVPPANIEGRLQLEARIAAKARAQLGLHVSATGRVGKASVVNEFLECRERLGTPSSVSQPLHPYFAVVRGPMAAAFAVRWKTDSFDAPELLTFAGSPPALIDDFTVVEEIVESLFTAEPVLTPPHVQLVDAFVATVRKRLASADRGPTNAAIRRLSRLLLSRAVVAGRHRRIEQLRILDAVLDRLKAGVPVGSERNLEDLLHDGGQWKPMATWLKSLPKSLHSTARIQLVAALFGDGLSKG